jgi:small subunit ribosomal protein S3
MGHKVHPYGYRIGINKPWLAKWYADRDYATLLQEDMAIRRLVSKQLANASVSQVEIERGINHVTVTVHTAKPGIVIGKGGANVELLRNSIGKLTDKKVKLEIKEVLQPELDAVLVAQSIAGQLERRIAFRKAVKQGVQRSIKAGAKGVKIQVSGRLGGTEMSRREWDKEGRIPLGTLRADISYGVVHAHTTYGRIGVKVWIYRGDTLADLPGSARTEPREARTAARSRPRTRSRAAAADDASAAESAVAVAEPEPAATGIDEPGLDSAMTPDAVVEEAVAEQAAPEAEVQETTAGATEPDVAEPEDAGSEATEPEAPAAAAEEPAVKAAAPAAAKAKATAKAKAKPTTKSTARSAAKTTARTTAKTKAKPTAKAEPADEEKG